MKMEECSNNNNNNNNNNRKRVRDDSEADSSESKFPRVDANSDVNSSESQLSRVNSAESCVDSGRNELGRVKSDEAVVDSSGVSEIQDDLLNILDDTDNVAERDPTMQGLDSVIKSFEDEIFAPGHDAAGQNAAPGSGEMQPNLGYLLEASDDELGLPPTVTQSEEEERKPVEWDSGRVGPEGVDLTGFLGFEDYIPNYEDFGFGNGLPVEYSAADNGGGYVTLDGLFDYSEPADILWRSESLQAM